MLVLDPDAQTAEPAGDRGEVHGGQVDRERIVAALEHLVADLAVAAVSDGVLALDARAVPA